MSNLIVPFNYDSGTTSRKVSTYTVGVGKYCYAHPLDVACAVNSDLVFLDLGIGGGVATGTYLVGHTNWTGRINGGGNTLTFILVNGASHIALGSGTDLYITNGIMKGGTPPNVAAATAAGQFLAVSLLAGSLLMYQGFLHGAWYKAGDILSGGYWLVTEYNSVT
mgnify:CR=1 FL=1